ncbi:MAG: sulfurtransferase TusA family protein [Desulfobulbaceae bacterium]|nr:MAG: sulfurtransferase TusA family protein [Desulfobulbaceae bacterium]
MKKRMDKKQKNIEIDMRGQVCPSTMLVALEAINKYGDELHGGMEQLCILTDNREATNTIPDIAVNMGYAVQVDRQDSFYRITLSCAE